MAVDNVIKLHPCRISRRGKAAKGTVIVKTFGIPVPNAAGIAKDWLYNSFTTFSLDFVIAKVKELANVNDAIIIQSLLMGMDLGQKSDSIRSQSENSLLANRIYANGLAIDKDEAERLAAKWIANIKFAAENDIEMDIETLLAKRTVIVAKLKAEGVWTSTAPRLVDNRKVEETKQDGIEEDIDEDTDSEDDSESEIEPE